MSFFNRKELLPLALYGMLLPALGVTLLLLIHPSLPKAAIISGSLLGLLAVFLQLVALYFYRDRPADSLMKYYYYGLVARFFAVCTLFALTLLFTKIDETGFTFSFIISYVCYSVFEVIYLTNKINHWNRPV